MLHLTCHTSRTYLVLNRKINKSHSTVVKELLNSTLFPLRLALKKLMPSHLSMNNLLQSCSQHCPGINGSRRLFQDLPGLRAVRLWRYWDWKSTLQWFQCVLDQAPNIVRCLSQAVSIIIFWVFSLFALANKFSILVLGMWKAAEVQFWLCSVWSL